MNKFKAANAGWFNAVLQSTEHQSKPSVFASSIRTANCYYLPIFLDQRAAGALADVRILTTPRHYFVSVPTESECLFEQKHNRHTLS